MELRRKSHLRRLRKSSARPGPGYLRKPGQWLIWSLGVALLFAALLAQEMPRLRVTNYSVVVDVVVTDRNNRPITDLTIEDFTVLENGAPQQIESIQLIHPESAMLTRRVAATEPTAEPESQEPAEELKAEPTPNLIIVLLDYATVDFVNQTYVRDAAIQYVQEKLKPNDLVAVFKVGLSLDFVQGFTNDPAQLVRALDRTDPTGSSFALDQTRLRDQGEQVQDVVENLTTSLDSIINTGPGPGPGAGALAAILNNQLDQAQALEGTYYAQLSYSRDQQSRPVIGAIRTIADGVRHITGRKSLILFSEGFAVPLTVERALYAAVERAARANLAIYAIDAAGLMPRHRTSESELYDISAARSGDRVRAHGGLSQFDRAREIGSDQKDSTLRFLASRTGGLLIRHTNDFLDALERVDADMRTHYLLTYQPANLQFDGEFRELTVEVNRRKVRVRARPGYWAVPAGASLLTADEFKVLVQNAGSEEKSPEELPMFVQPSYFLSDENSYDVALTVEIPVESIRAQSHEGQEFLHLNLTGIVQDEMGQTVTSFRGPSRLRLGDGDQRGYLRLQSSLNLTPGRYLLVVRGEDPVTRRSRIVRRALRLRVPDGRTQLSSLVLAESLSAAQDTEDRFSVDGVKLFPSARRRFADGDQVVCYLNIHRPGLNGAGSDLDLDISVVRAGRLLSRSTEKLSAALAEPQPMPGLRVARMLQLEGLQPGRYMLRVKVTDNVRDQQLSAQTAFDIVR